jgi:hypothetical protein
MPISVTCSQCGKRYSVKDEMAGKSAKCGCGAQLVVPVPAKETPTDQPAAPTAATGRAPLDRGANIRRNLYLWRKKLILLFGGLFLLAIGVCIAAISYAHANHLSTRRIEKLGEGMGVAFGVLFGAVTMVVLLMAHRKKGE